MHTGLLHLHNLLRWVVLIAGVIAVVRAQRALSGNSPYARGPGMIFVMALHTQLLIGLALYFGTSGYVASFLAAPGASMKDAVLRFFGMEHLVMMLAAIVVGTIGSAKARRGADDGAKNRAARTFFAVALVLLLAGIPWPFRAVGAGRAWLPGMKPAAMTTAPATTTGTAPSTPLPPG
ncbi:MAG: hypothetical protein FJ137_02590 [Deltaproteobacteria bacterium]|nr:hypothetical protein [Deltaproteobacteria bacterium]